MATTGPRLTRLPSREDVVGPLTAANGTKLYAEDTATHRARHARLNPRDNAISKLAYGIAGTMRRFYELPQDEKTEIRSIATRLHTAGLTTGTAEAAELVVEEGFVYIVTNPAWPDWVKVGKAFDPNSRLTGYQTGSPLRDYVLEHTAYSSHRRKAEAHCHMILKVMGHEWTGEWFKCHVAAARNVLNQIDEGV